MTRTPEHIIVIGAGPAGLTAAYELLKQGRHVTVLEAENMVGGISRTIAHDGNLMDLGGHRFFSKDDWVMQFWRDLLPIQGKPAWDDLQLLLEKQWSAGGPDPETTDRVMLLRRRVSRILYLHRFFDYPVTMRWQTFRSMGLKRTLEAGFGCLFSMIHKRPEVSLKDFMINRFGEPLYRMFFEKYTEKLWGRNPAEIVASWGAQRIKGVSLLSSLANILRKHIPFSSRGKVETSLIEEFIYPKKGPGQLWETLAAKIRDLGGEIVLNAEVEGIELDEKGQISAVIANESGSKRRYEGTAFVSSMPVKDLVAAFPAGHFPADVCGWAAELPYRDFITIGLEVPRLAISNQTRLKTLNQLIPDCWIYVQEPEVRLGRLQIFNNWSPYMVRDHRHAVWMGLEYFCAEHDEMWEMSDEAFIQFAVRELQSIGVISADTPVHSAIRLRVRKAYPAYFGSYVHFASIRAQLDRIPNLYCIGRNGQHRYNNMDHSMLTAKEAVRLIVSGEHDKSRLWNINTEEEYHEQK